MQYLKFALLKKRIRGIIPMIKDKEVSFWKKFLLLFGLVYLFLPFDLIPPLIPVFGWFDDIILWIFILYYLRDELDKHAPDVEEQPEGARRKKSWKIFKKDNVYDVDFTVKEDSAEENDNSACDNGDEDKVQEEKENVE